MDDQNYADPLDTNVPKAAESDQPDGATISKDSTIAAQADGDSGLGNLSNVELVALEDSPEKETALRRRLTLTPVANRLAYRLLVMWSRKRDRPLTHEEEVEFYDALNGLRGCCFRARRNLSVPVESGDLSFQSSRSFFEDRIFLVLEKYRGLSESELQGLALAGRLKDIPRQVYFDLLDCIKQKYTRKSRTLDFSRLEAPDQVKDSRDEAGTTNASRIDSAIELLNVCKDELIRQVGEDGWTVLSIVVDSVQKGEIPDTRQDRKGVLTREIAKTLKLEQRQASQRKKSMQDKMWKALREANPVVTQFYSHLIGPTMESSTFANRSCRKYESTADDDAPFWVGRYEDIGSEDSNSGPV